MSDSLTIFDIDFGSYERTEFEGPVRLPEGDYLVRFTGVEKVTVKNENSPNFGKPGFKVTLEVVNGPHAGAKLTDNLWVIDKALFRLDQFFSAFGIKVEKGKLQLPVAQVLNKTLGVEVKDGAPFGEKQTVKSEIKRYKHASAVTGTEAPAPVGNGFDTSGVDL